MTKVFVFTFKRKLIDQQESPFIKKTHSILLYSNKHPIPIPLMQLLFFYFYKWVFWYYGGFAF